MAEVMIITKIERFVLVVMDWKIESFHCFKYNLLVKDNNSYSKTFCSVLLLGFNKDEQASVSITNC